jgi:hypothetical protein
MKNNALLALHTEVQRAVEWWNKRRFGNLPPVMIGFYPQTPRGQRLGHYLPECWIKGKHKSAEIVLYADLCLAAGPKEVLLTVVHELVHHWQRMKGGKLGKKVGHNKEWHRKAGEVGLVTKGPKGFTEAGPLFEKDAKAFHFKIDKIVFRSVPRRARQVGKMKKWVCAGECNGSVRSGKAEIYLICGVCGDVLEPDEG